MKRMIGAIVVLVSTLAGTMTWCTAVADEDNQLTLAVIRTEEMSTLAQRWEIAIDYLKAQHNLDVNFYATTSYASVVEAMLSGFVDVGSLGPKIYLVAHEKSNGAIEPVVSYALPADMFMDEPCGCYYGSFVTKKGSGLTTIESTQGKVLALVDPGSTSGNAAATRSVRRPDRRRGAGGLLRTHLLLRLAHRQRPRHSERQGRCRLRFSRYVAPSDFFRRAQEGRLQLPLAFAANSDRRARRRQDTHEAGDGRTRPKRISWYDRVRGRKRGSEGNGLRRVRAGRGLTFRSASPRFLPSRRS